MRKVTPLAVRFWSKVERSDTCWLWTGARGGSNGQYGVIGTGDSRANNVQQYAHRVAWILTYGDIPAGLQVLHRCDNPPCVRPDHLFLGTQLDNMRDMLTKGRAWLKGHPERALHGEEHGSAKLPTAAVVAIRADRERGLLHRELAAKYGIGMTQVGRICRREQRTLE